MADPEQLYARLVSAFQQGRWTEAAGIAEQLLPLAPRHAGVFGIAGIVQLELRDPARAADLLGHATTLDPQRPDFATLHAKALMESHRTGEALRAANRAFDLAGRDAGALDTLGVLYARGEQQAQAAKAFRAAVAVAPNHAPFRFNLATALTTLGDFNGAQNELEACLSLDGRHWPAHLALAHLRTQTPQSQHIERLLALLSQHPHDPHAVVYLHMALAKEYEDLGEDGQAFAHMTQGKAARRRQRPYQFDRDRTLFDQLTRAFPEPSPSIVGDPTDEPIFIIGMPRTGTTLVERILARHPDVHAAGELQNFAVALQQASRSAAPFLLSAELPARGQRIDWRALGAAYLASTRPATGHTRRFIDKLPHNFLYTGFIAKALPRAKIICLRRDPMDTSLSNFRQLFDNPSIHFDYANDLLDSGRYVARFGQLMHHWNQVFPGRILTVDYENLVSSPEPVTREMLAFCELPWHAGCLQVEDNASPVATFSATQARQPIHQASMQRWKRYEGELQGLRIVLRDHGVPVP
jgi:tetratricopeptide (TPR) repeat protein